MRVTVPPSRMEFQGMLGVSDCAVPYPACAPVNASPAALRLHSHDSGSGWFAIPFLWDSFLPCSMPVYPGALGVVPKNHVCPSKGGGPQKPRDIQSRVLRDRSSCS